MKKLLAVTLLSVALLGCVNSTRSGVSNVNRSQIFLVSSDELNAQASTAYAQTISDSKKKGILNTDKQLYNRVNSISQKLIQQAPFFRPDAKNWQWEVNVITSDTLNAWCMPGGKIAVYSGIVKTLNLTDDEIAVVIGHEIAHALREHSREQASQEVVRQGVLGIASIFGINDTLVSAGDVASQVAVSLPFSREHETEADEIGLELCARAGFNVDAAVSVWEKMSKASQNEPIELLSTHPSNQSRINNLKNLAQVLKQKYPTTK